MIFISKLYMIYSELENKLELQFKLRMNGKIIDPVIQEIEIKVKNFLDELNIYDNAIHIDLCNTPKNRKLALVYRVRWDEEGYFEGAVFEIVEYEGEFEWYGSNGQGNWDGLHCYRANECQYKEIDGEDFYDSMQTDGDDGDDDDDEPNYLEIEKQKIFQKVMKWCYKKLDRVRLGWNLTFELIDLINQNRLRWAKKALDKTCLCSDLQNHIIKFLI